MGIVCHGICGGLRGVFVWRLCVVVLYRGLGEGFCGVLVWWFCVVVLYRGLCEVCAGCFKLCGVSV
jgi:hypothetical protein